MAQLAEVIKELTIHRISDLELRKINRKLEGITIVDKEDKKRIRKQHVQSIQMNRKDKKRKEQESIRQNACPKYNCELSLKTGKYGTFYG